MSEGYTFSGNKELPTSIELTEFEVESITRLGITQEDLRSLLANEPFAEGSRALLFDAPDNKPMLAVKVWKNREIDTKRGINENTALRLLRMSEFNMAPKLGGYIESSNMLIEEKVDAKPIEQFDSKAISRLAEALATLHSIKLNKFGRSLADRKEGTYMDYLHENTESLREQASVFNDQQDVYELINNGLNKIDDSANKVSEAFLGSNFTLIHFDLNKGNILYSEKDNNIAIVDWEQASAGDNAMDIAKLFLKVNFEDSQKNDFLSTYESKLPEKDPYFTDRLSIYERFVLINSIMWRLNVLRGFSDQPASEKEKQFYNQVRTNLDREIGELKKW